MTNKLLKFVIRLENVLSVYRNFRFFSTFVRIFICIRILVLIALAIFCIVYYILYVPEFHIFRAVYIILTAGTSIIVSLISLLRSRDFQKFMTIIDSNHEYFSKDSVYLKNLDKTYKIVVFISCFYIFSSLGSTLLFSLLNGFNKEVNEFVFRIYTINMSLCGIRYSIEYIVLYALLFLLSEHVKCITRKISRDRNLESFESEENNAVPNTDDEITEEITSFAEWTVAYTNIKECSKLINSIFGIQITVMLTALTYYFIMFLYMMAYMGVYYGLYKTADVVMYSSNIVGLLIALYALSRSAQTAQNSVIHLQRRLAKLLIYSSSDEDTYKAAKDFLHLVTNRPIKTKAFGSINVDMTLVPKFVMFFTSYTIIALQFNNVL